MGLPVLQRPIEPSTLDSGDGDARSEARLKQRLRRAARLKPRPARCTAPPPDREDSFADDSTTLWFVSRTGVPRWRIETGIRRLAVDNSVLLRSSENNDDDLVRVVPDLPAATAPGNTQSSDGAAPPEPSKTDLMPLKDLVELASRVLERHSMELEAPSRSQKFLRASAPKRTRKSPLRETALPDPGSDPVVAILPDPDAKKPVMPATTAQRQRLADLRRMSVEGAMLELFAERRNSLSGDAGRRGSMSGSRRPSIAERKSSFGSLSRRRPSTSSNLVERKAASMVDVYHADPAKDETKAASPSSFSFSSEGGTLLGADLKVSPVSEPPEMPMISESVQARKRSWASDLALDLSDLHISDPGRHKRSPSDTFRISKPGAGGFVRDRVLPYADDGPDDALPPLRNRRRASSAAELTYNWGR